MELWKDVIGFEDVYEVSNKGRVKRKKGLTKYKDGRVAKFSETILKQSINHKGYLRVFLSKNSKKSTRTVHRLVAEAWIENPENKQTVNHIDLNKKNNCVYNLEWLTNKENMRHGFKNGAFDNAIKKSAERLAEYNKRNK